MFNQSNQRFVLQCLTDFSNLDGLATGTAGAGDGAAGAAANVQLAVSEKLVVKSDAEKPGRYQ